MTGYPVPNPKAPGCRGTLLFAAIVAAAIIRAVAALSGETP